MLTEKIKNADRIHRANNFVVQAIENETNREIMKQMLAVSQAISDVHKACIADLKFAERDGVWQSDKIRV